MEYFNLVEILKYVEEHSGSAFFYTPNYFGGINYFFKRSKETVFSHSLNPIEALKLIDDKTKGGLIAYGIIPFEIGYLFEERLNSYYLESSEQFRFYFSERNDVEIIDSSELNFEGIPDILSNSYARVKDFRINKSRKEFSKHIEQIRDYIRRGDTYQVNYTVEANFSYSGSPTELFLRLLFNQSANYACMINESDKLIISVSPELFFEVKEDTIKVKPMKGTIKRGIDSEEDLKREAELKESVKDRAENIMIVDLLRNDIGKISEYNSVSPKEILEIEKYETVFQMVSTVESKLKTGNFSDIIRNLFPCGSVTGAPKIRTMEIIKELEARNRGVYTGAIGIIDDNFISFNVAIRTVELKADGKGKVGLGAGIVWDSNPASEYEETIAKVKFLTDEMPYFEIIETMLSENGEVLFRNEHLQRMRKTADYFLFKFDESKFNNTIDRENDKLDVGKAFKIRLLLNKWGIINCEITEIVSTEKSIKAVVSSRRIDSVNKFRGFKTTNRGIFDLEYKKYKSKGYDEVIFMNEREELTEGAISNIFVKIEGEWFTPPKECGLLPGVYRNYLISRISATEKVLYEDDLKRAEEVLLCNSVRKEMRTMEIRNAENEIIFYSTAD